ncbi:MAG: DUF6629 family protein [Rhizomicrobium sp.]
MCFSAAASFAAASVAATAGVLTLSSVTRVREIPLAGAPLIFALQQAIEGALWLTLPHAAISLLALCLANGFVVCAMVVWPLLAPLATSLVEPIRWRRRAISWLVPLGVAFALYSAIDIAAHPYHAVISYKSLCYINNSPYPFYAIFVYFAATCGGFLLSSHGALRVFGLIVVAGLLVSAAFFLTALVSVWCFFAAAASATLLIYFRRGRLRTRMFGAR